MASKCFLRCLANRHPDIALEDGVRKVVGRSAQTKIKDGRVSREHIALTPNFAKYRAKLHHLGSNKGRITRGEDGNCVSTSNTELKGYEVYHQDKIELVEDKFGYQIFFSPNPKAAKRKSEEIKADSSVKGSRKSGDSPPPPMAAKRPKTSKEMQKQRNFDVSETSGGGIWKSVNEMRFLKLSDGWEESDGPKDVLIYTHPDCRPREKIAAFDMDGTIITTASGKVFPKDLNDWRILFPEVPKMLRNLVENGYKIVIFTNQAGIKKGKVSPRDFRTKIERISSKLGSGVPFQLFASCADGSSLVRKPRTGLWRLLLRHSNQKSVSVDYEKSFYCGDAAGRSEGWISGKKKDFSCSDRLFAANCGLKFYTPEEYFLGQKATQKFSLPDFDPRTIGQNDGSFLIPSTEPLRLSKQEMVMLVGIQGSGKSHLSEHEFEPHGYIIASNDRTGSRDKTLKLLDQALSNGRSVVVDNTHGDKETRAKYLKIAMKYPQVERRCFVMAATFAHAQHNNLFRELVGEKHAVIKAPLFFSYRSKYQEPQLDEGFSSISKVNFIPKFRSQEEENLYKSFLVEK